MKLIEFQRFAGAVRTNSDGMVTHINPDHVVAVSTCQIKGPVTVLKDRTILLLVDGTEIVVKGDASEVRAKLTGNTIA